MSKVFRGMTSAPSPQAIADALGIDLSQAIPQTAFMRPPAGGLFANSTTPVCVGPKFSQFFAKNYAPAKRVADAYGVDVTMPLGLSANESGWGESRMARAQNNIAGATPDGTHGVTYRSAESAWQHWGQQWGKRINGAGDDADLFLRRLAMNNQGVPGAVDNRGTYNTQDTSTKGSPDWMPNSRSAINSVRRRLPFWLASGC
jgi:hypothetical protein